MASSRRLRSHALTLQAGSPRSRPVPEANALLQVWYGGGTESVVARAFREDDRFLLDSPGVGTFAFTRGRSTVLAWRDPGVSDETLADVFFRQLQPIVLQANGWQALHASSSVTANGLLVLCGRAHSGKSTLAYALSERGCPQFGDDQLIWRPQDGSFETRPLPFTSRLRASARAFLGETSSRRPRPAPAEPTTIARVVVLNQLKTATAVSLTPMPGPDAFTCLLGFAHLFNPVDREETARLVHDYSELVNRVPVFSLTYPAGFAQFERVLETLAPEPPRSGSTPGQ